MTYWLSFTLQPADQPLELARKAEDLGSESVYMGEHVLLPTPYDSPYPAGRAAQLSGRTGPFVRAFPWIGPLEPVIGARFVEWGAPALEIPAWEQRDHGLNLAEKGRAAEQFVRRVMDEV